MAGLALPLTARAPDGRRIALTLTDTAATLTLTDDLAALERRARRRRPRSPPAPSRARPSSRSSATLLGGTDG